jgi:2-phospho-L-lactate guanylyltransferase
MTSFPAAPAWRLVVPVKGGAGAKSRLHPPAGVPRSALAWAMARDCLAAVCTALPPSHVHVVSSDETVRSYAAGLGAVAVPDPGRGLDEAVRAGLRSASASATDQGAAWLRPRAATDGDVLPADGLAVLLGDLPCLRPDDLRAGLAAAARHPRAVVPDAQGSGTVLLTSLTGHLEPAFGAGSAARHAAAGHHRLDLALPRLRTDVDDDRSLAAALALGVGPATLRVLEDRRDTLPGMQASVHTFDETTGAGTALLDDGREVAFPAEVFARSALRHLRAGQRVSIELTEGTTTVERLWIVGIGDDQRIG